MTTEWKIKVCEDLINENPDYTLANARDVIKDIELVEASFIEYPDNILKAYSYLFCCIICTLGVEKEELIFQKLLVYFH